jgi:transposase
VGAGAEIDELRAALAARDADLAARDAHIARLERQLDRALEQLGRVAELETELARVQELEAELAKLRELLGRDSSNSSKPPSSDPPGTGAKARKKKTKGRGRGGQRGHDGSHRELLPPERMDAFEDHFPCTCARCHASLPQVPDPDARRYQHTDLDRDGVFRTEHRRHRVTCPSCGHETRAKYDPNKIPRYPFGPGLMAAVVLLTGVYHLSRRRAARLLWELLGVRISVGAVSRIEKRMSEVVAPAVDEAVEHARAAKIKHADGTSWYRAGVMASLWVLATAAVTAFKVLPDGQGETLRDKLFVKVCGVLVSDRATALKFWAMKRRQICWAHLLRKFVSFSQRDGPAGRIGRELLDYTSIVFDYWSSFREGRLSRAELIARMAPVRLQVEALLERAVAKDIKGLSGSCEDILEHREALWTFVEQAGVEPTNNHAERELRAFVLWRRRSFGSRSERGDRFAERMMTIAHTLRKQGRSVLDFLVACGTPRPAGEPDPSLLAAT